MAESIDTKIRDLTRATIETALPKAGSDWMEDVAVFKKIFEHWRYYGITKKWIAADQSDLLADLIGMMKLEGKAEVADCGERAIVRMLAKKNDAMDFVIPDHLVTTTISAMWLWTKKRPQLKGRDLPPETSWTEVFWSLSWASVLYLGFEKNSWPEAIPEGDFAGVKRKFWKFVDVCDGPTKAVHAGMAVQGATTLQEAIASLARLESLFGTRMRETRDGPASPQPVFVADEAEILAIRDSRPRQFCRCCGRPANEAIAKGPFCDSCGEPFGKGHVCNPKGVKRKN